MTTEKIIKEQCQGTNCSNTSFYIFIEKEDWSFTDDLYKELKDNILK